MTPLAKAILQVVKESPQPIGAYDIAAKLARQSRKAVHANSVYRCLADLGRAGHVRQIASTKGFVPVTPRDGRKVIWLIRQECHRTETACATDCYSLLEKVTRDRGFRAETFIIELLGQCAACKGAELNLAP
jgi:Fur family transcriptional regulator, zinc uptake regulator